MGNHDLVMRGSSKSILTACVCFNFENKSKSGKELDGFSLFFGQL